MKTVLYIITGIAVVAVAMMQTMLIEAGIWGELEITDTVLLWLPRATVLTLVLAAWSGLVAGSSGYTQEQLDDAVTAERIQIRTAYNAADIERAIQARDEHWSATAAAMEITAMKDRSSLLNDHHETILKVIAENKQHRQKWTHWQEALKPIMTARLMIGNMLEARRNPIDTQLQREEFNIGARIQRLGGTQAKALEVPSRAMEQFKNFKIE